MDEQLFLEQIEPRGEAESSWLKDLFSFVSQNICPLVSGPSVTGQSVTQIPEKYGVCSHQLSVSLVKKIHENSCVTHTLPVSYRLVSVSELLSQQHLPCVSNLSWSTNQHRAWVNEVELTLPDHQALSRVSLLLIGCLRGGQAGEWTLMDASGSVSCEVLSPSPLWLNCPVFLPHWNYIPHNPPGPDQDGSGGHVEVIGCPVLLCASPQQGLAAGPGGEMELCRAVGVREAISLLRNRTRGQRVSVCGRVCSVCPLLVVAGTSFFCFSLTDDVHRLAILVKERSRLWWAQCLCMGQHVCVTALRVCVLQGWRGNKILCVTGSSEMHTEHAHTPADETHTDPELDTSPPLMMSHIDNDTSVEVEPDIDINQSALRIKRSRVITYQGTVTEVVSEGAGLYVIDKKVGLCLAYQPALKRKLRVGDTVEISHVHFLYRPCPDFLPIMLGTCLRSSLRVTAFSRVGGSALNRRCPADGVLAHLLLEKNMGVSEYLWSCHMSSQLSHSLIPSVLKQQCVCLLSWKLVESVWRRGKGGGRRDIYSEMLDESHTCPLTWYSVDSAAPQYISISELCKSLQSHCWSVSLSSLLPPGGSSLTRSEINTALSWSFNIVSSNPSDGDSLRQRPLLVVGVLGLPSQKSERGLQLRDGTGAVTCVLTETDQLGGQRAAFNTAWIGCLVCVQQFTMTTERFIHSDFPSYQHLEQEDKHIINKHCRIYLQFSLDHAHILSPSIAMAAHLDQRMKKSGDKVTERKQEMEEGKEDRVTAGSKRRRQKEDDSASVTAGPVCSRPCVSVVIRVEHKEGVAWRNVETGLGEGEAGLILCFSVRAAMIGPVVTWKQDPKNRPMMDKEAESQEKVQMLVFSGVSACWSTILQPGLFYRLVATDTQDPSVLSGCGVSAQSGVELHTEPTLQVQPDWRFHTLLLPSYRQAPSPKVLSVSEVLDCSLDLVCFQALLCDRTNLTDRTGDTKTGVRLTVCGQTGRSLQVYLDLSHTPYPLGLLPGNTLLFSAFQRRLSRTGSVYCRYLPISSVSVLSVGDLHSAPPPAAPMMHLGKWEGSSVGQVKGHVVCFLFLQLQWSCSLCGSVYTQSCSSHQCLSTSSIFQSKAKLVIDDGTGEAHVFVSGALVRPLLGLSDCQWEGLQRAIKVRGQLEVNPWGRSLVCDSNEPLLHFLLCVCSSDAVCRQFLLTCRNHGNQRSEEVKRFTRGDRDFMTRMKRPLQLSCLSLTPLTSPV